MGLLVRLDFALRLSGPFLLAGDAASYHSIAQNLLQGNGFQNTAGEVPVLPPLYPLFLSFLYLLFGQNFFMVQLIQILLNLAAVFMAYLIVKKYFLKNSFFSLLFLFLGVLYPFFIYWSRYLLTDINFVFLNILLIYLTVMLREEHKGKFILTGLVMGLAVLQRGVILFLPFFLFFYYWITFDIKYACKFLIITLAVISLFIFAWGSYNLNKHGKFVPVASYGGLSLYMGNNPYACPERIYYSDNTCYDRKYMRSIKNKNFLEKNALCQKKAMSHILGHPFLFIKNSLIKMKVYWHEQRYKRLVQWPVIKILDPFVRILDSLLLYFGFIGFILMLREYKKYLLFYIMILYYTLISSVFVITELARFRLPIMLFVIFFAVKAVEFFYSLIIKGFMKK